MENIKSTLKKGELIIFESEDHYMEVGYREFLCGNKYYYTQFNLIITKATKTYPAIEKEIKRLVNKYDLVQVIEEGKEQVCFIN